MRTPFSRLRRTTGCGRVRTWATVRCSAGRRGRQRSGERSKAGGPQSDPEQTVVHCNWQKRKQLLTSDAVDGPLQSSDQRCRAVPRHTIRTAPRWRTGWEKITRLLLSDSRPPFFGSDRLFFEDWRCPVVHLRPVRRPCSYAGRVSTQAAPRPLAAGKLTFDAWIGPAKVSLRRPSGKPGPGNEGAFDSLLANVNLRAGSGRRSRLSPERQLAQLDKHNPAQRRPPRPLPGSARSPPPGLLYRIRLAWHRA